MLKTGKVAVFIGWYSQITIHFQRVLLAGAYPETSPTAAPERLRHSANGLVMTNNASRYAATMICPRRAPTRLPPPCSS